MKTFEDLDLVEPILRAITAEGLTHPTPIQSQAIPALLAGQDVMGIAQTGTGKTAAFALPLLNKISRQTPIRTSKSCSLLVLTPTRELAAQITNNIKNYCNFSHLKVTLVVGGVRPGNQIKALKAGVDIVVATPGRLLDHMNTGAISLAKTHSVVLDEADQMLDLGFFPAIRKIIARAPRDRQTAMFSATMPNQIKKLADDFLSNPAEITVAAVSKPIERIVQSVRHVERAHKRQALTEIVSDPKASRTIVFTRTKRGADRVCKHLTVSGLTAGALHGDKSQRQRDRILSDFRTGNSPILVATDIAARGIDIDGITHVVNFDLPEVPEAYVHRIGRTARAGKSGVAVSLCDSSERKLLRGIEKLIGTSIAAENEMPAVPAPEHPNSTKKVSDKRNQPIRNKRKHKSRKRPKHKAKSPANDQKPAGTRRRFANNNKSRAAA